MHRKTLPVLVLAVFAAMLVGAAPANASWHSCSATNSKTVQRIGKVRVFTRVEGKYKLKTWYVCSTAYGRRIKLHFGMYPGDEEFSKFTVAGRFIAYVQHFSCGACSGPVGSYVTVVDLRLAHSSWGAKETYLSADKYADCPVNYVEDCPPVITNLVLRRTASFAVSFAVKPVQPAAPAGAVPFNAIEKHEFGAGLRTENITVLDRVTPPDLKSLKLVGATLNWTNAGVAKTAPIK